MGVENGANYDYSVYGDMPSNKMRVLKRVAARLLAVKDSHGRINSGYLNISHHALSLAINNQPGGWERLVRFAGLDPELERSQARHPAKVNGEQASS